MNTVLPNARAKSEIRLATGEISLPKKKVPAAEAAIPRAIL
jgi:hypothetical protein